VALFYEDLIETTIVKQLSKQLEDCRYTGARIYHFATALTLRPTFPRGSFNSTNQERLLVAGVQRTIPIPGTHGRLVKPKDRLKRQSSHLDVI
jgi:hypothetical protein